MVVQGIRFVLSQNL